MKYNKTQQGFTIIELMIATTIFSVVLLAMSATVIQISRMYYKGIVMSQTQAAARNIMEEISRPIQLEGATVAVKTGVVSVDGYELHVICVGTTRYTAAVGLMQDSKVTISGDHLKHVVWQDKVASPDICMSDPPLNLATNLSSGKDLLPDKMRLTKFEVEPDGPDTRLWKVNIGVMYGERDLMDPPDDTTTTADIPQACLSSYVGGQWCAKAEYSTEVLKRIGN